MKKILIVTTVGGFVTKFEQNNLDILNELGYEIHYAANFSNTIYEIDYEALERRNVIIHDLPIEKSVTKAASHRRNIKLLTKLIDDLGITVVHCHTPVGGVLARFAARKSNSKPYVIYTAHGFHFYKGCPIANRIYYPVEKYMARFTDCLVTINEEDYEKAGKFRKNLKVVKIPGVGLDTEVFTPATEANEHEGYRLVTIGEINRNKNHEVVIKALKLLGDTKISYTIYGKGDRIEYLKKMVDEYGLNEQVEFAGYCNNPQEVLKETDVFVFPSIREGLGMAALEALACGVPVVGLDNRGTREYLRDGKNGLVCKRNDAKEFAYNIRKACYGIDFDREKAKLVARDTALKFQIKNTEEIMRNVYGGIENRGQ